ncbi:MAG: hypothetical protein LH614_17155 [Pyrinomonadaceae bacterium]|nr:hypothetical protein [Pyrinomonadaceae bacterium]
MKTWLHENRIPGIYFDCARVDYLGERTVDGKVQYGFKDECEAGCTDRNAQMQTGCGLIHAEHQCPGWTYAQFTWFGLPITLCIESWLVNRRYAGLVYYHDGSIFFSDRGRRRFWVTPAAFVRDMYERMLDDKSRDNRPYAE